MNSFLAHNERTPTPHHLKRIQQRALVLTPICTKTDASLASADKNMLQSPHLLRESCAKVSQQPPTPSGQPRQAHSLPLFVQHNYPAVASVSPRSFSRKITLGYLHLDVWGWSSRPRHRCSQGVHRRAAEHVSVPWALPRLSLKADGDACAEPKRSARRMAKRVLRIWPWLTRLIQFQLSTRKHATNVPCAPQMGTRLVGWSRIPALGVSVQV